MQGGEKFEEKVDTKEIPRDQRIAHSMEPGEKMHRGERNVGPDPIGISKVSYEEVGINLVDLYISNKEDNDNIVILYFNHTLLMIIILVA